MSRVCFRFLEGLPTITLTAERIRCALNRASKSTGARERRSQKRIMDGRKNRRIFEKKILRKRKDGTQNADMA